MEKLELLVVVGDAVELSAFQDVQGGEETCDGIQGSVPVGTALVATENLGEFVSDSIDKIEEGLEWSHVGIVVVLWGRNRSEVATVCERRTGGEESPFESGLQAAS